MAFEFSEVGTRDLAKKDGILYGGEVFLPSIEDGHLRDNPCYTCFAELLVDRIM